MTGLTHHTRRKPDVSAPVLLAGDRFVLNRLLAADLAAQGTGDPAAPGAADARRLELPWPDVPFGPVAEVDEASGTEEQLIEALQGVRVCLTQMAPLTARILDACPDLELFAVSRGGPVNANLAAATGHGVAVTFAPGRNATATAEYAVGLMLAAMRRIPQSHAGVVAGRWDSSLYAYDATGLEIEGATVGLVGAGAIGSRVARILLAFGADVLVADPYADPAALPAGVRLVDLDVFDVEPLPADHPLRSAPNVVLTPHLAGASRAVAERASRMVAAEAGRWFRGEPPLHCANPAVLETASWAGTGS